MQPAGITGDYHGAVAAFEAQIDSPFQRQGHPVRSDVQHHRVRSSRLEGKGSQPHRLVGGKGKVRDQAREASTHVRRAVTTPQIGMLGFAGQQFHLACRPATGVFN